MRISPLAVSFSVLAALCGWWFRGIQLIAETTPAPRPVATSAVPRSTNAAVSLSVQKRPADSSRASRSTRNLFAYREEIPRAQPAVFHPPAIVTAPVIAAPQLAEEKPRPRFMHRFIGKFGPEGRPIAAFARDGQIVTVRIGDRIDERFVLRSVGMESVEVEATDDGEVRTERVALSGSTR